MQHTLYLKSQAVMDHTENTRKTNKRNKKTSSLQMGSKPKKRRSYRAFIVIGNAFKVPKTSTEYIPHSPRFSNFKKEKQETHSQSNNHNCERENQNIYQFLLTG